MQDPTMENNHFNSHKWIRAALINFFIVALAGVILRYKINFPLPFINQKFLLHGHSHFAFVGWITLSLMALMVNYLIRSNIQTSYRKYNYLLIANTISAYGMLITFIIEGYAFFSITFSTLSILVSYLFAYHYWIDLKKIKQDSHIITWFKSALVLWCISAIGTFALGYLMARHIMVQELYFAAIYFFLHFQYNGWFIFTCFGLLFSFFKTHHQEAFAHISRRLYLILATTVVPSYLLSVFGFKIPSFLYWAGTLSTILQLGAIFYCYQLLDAIRTNLNTPLTKMTGLLWSLAYLSFTLKIIFQGLSVIPYFGTFSFSLRPVIIGYLHLCFLGVLSFFILGYFNALLSRHGFKLNKSGLLIFVAGVILQEVVLMTQALAAIMGNASTHAPIVLLISAVAMALGLAILSYQWCIKKFHNNKSHC